MSVTLYRSIFGYAKTWEMRPLLHYQDLLIADNKSTVCWTSWYCLFFEVSDILHLILCSACQVQNYIKFYQKCCIKRYRILMIK